MNISNREIGLKPTLKNYFSKLNKSHQISYFLYVTFYFLIITDYFIFDDFFISEKPRDYLFPIFEMLWACMFGIGGIVFFFKGKLKNADWALMALTLLTLVMLGLILWFYSIPG